MVKVETNTHPKVLWDTRAKRDLRITADFPCTLPLIHSETSCLLQASEVERQLSMQVHALKEDFREKNSSTNQHIIRLESLQAEVRERLRGRT
jgi:hypothetical protein